MDDTKVSPSSEMEQLTMQQGDNDGGIVEGADSIQDQIIIAPEIMSRILEQLDLQTLKQVRLVCKSWLREAGTHMKKKGNVGFNSETLPDFVETFYNGTLDLPKPFRSIRFRSNYTDDDDCELFLSQLSSLCPPLVMTKFDAERIPLDLTIALIIESSASLEYLHIATTNTTIVQKGLIFAKENVLLKLRKLHVGTYKNFPGSGSEYFPSVVAGIVECSPNLETFKSSGIGGQSSETLMRVRVENVKTLILEHGDLIDEVLYHIAFVPFSRLENLKMCLTIADNFISMPYEIFPVYNTVAKCTESLRILDLSDVSDTYLLTGFPACPHLQELSLMSFPESSYWLSVSFPALQVLTVHSVSLDVLGNFWNDLTPFMGLKTLRVHRISIYSRHDVRSEDRIEEPLRFLEKFPALDSLRINSSFVLQCCILKATGDSRFSSLLEGVKTLELIGKDDGSAALNLAPLAVLKGVERIAIISAYNRDILSLPYKDMPSLRVIQFPWFLNEEAHSCPMDQILEMARGVEKVVVTSSWRGRRYSESPNDLQLFFDSALNAELGSTDCQNTPSW